LFIPFNSPLPANHQPTHCIARTHPQAAKRLRPEEQAAAAKGYPRKRAAGGAAAPPGGPAAPYQAEAAAAAEAAAGELPDSFLMDCLPGSLGELLGSFPGSALSLGELAPARQDSFELGGRRAPPPAPAPPLGQLGSLR
jgi:hypothetical protein